MPDYKYIVVGGGMTGHAAAQGIRSVDASAPILLIGEEPVRPYARPPLTKGLWTGQEEGSIWLPAIEGIQLRTGTRVVAIDRAERRVRLEGGETIGYERLLLATGGTPRRLPFGSDEIIYYRTVADYRYVHGLQIGKRVAVVGGGFIGSEIAASLATTGYQVTLVLPQEGIGARLFPRDLAVHLNGYYAEREVEVRTGERLDRDRGARRRDSHSAPTGQRSELTSWWRGSGIVPNDRLAAEAGLAVDDGILVDESAAHVRPAVFAAGDVARFPNPALGSPDPRRARGQRQPHGTGGWSRDGGS